MCREWDCWLSAPRHHPAELICLVSASTGMDASARDRETSVGMRPAALPSSRLELRTTHGRKASLRRVYLKHALKEGLIWPGTEGQPGAKGPAACSRLGHHSSHESPAQGCVRAGWQWGPAQGRPLGGRKATEEGDGGPSPAR